MAIDWNKYQKHTPMSHKTFNINKLVPNNFAYSDADIKEFNEIYRYCLEQERLGKLKKFVNTSGLTVSRKLENYIGARYTVMLTSTTITLLLKQVETAELYLFRVGKKKKSKEEVSGRHAFNEYVKVLNRFGVNIDDLAIDNGFEVKQTIPSPKIELVDAEPGVTYRNCHHLDINSAFNAGMMRAFPVLEPAIRHIYNKRKENPRYKDILNFCQGFMQSKFVGYRFAHISKAGYEFTNNYIDTLAAELKTTGRKVLAYNTDGIWYQGEIFHNRDEGKDIGQWKTDYKKCKLRFKSKGSYEFIEDGQYHPVVRGQTSYEKLVPREEWGWGDIFLGCVLEYRFDFEKGVVQVAAE